MGTGKIQRTVMSGILPYFQDVLTGLTSPTAIVIVPTLSVDYNDDGTVDAADYVFLRKIGGSPDDFNTWQTNFGATLNPRPRATGSAGGPVIPEPSALLLILSAAAGVCFRRH
jgi:hypothetical protein